MYGFDLSYLNSDSFRENSFNDRVFVAPSLTWKPSEKTEFNITIEHLDEDRVYDSGLPATKNGVVKVPITRQFDNPGLFDRHDYILTDFNWSHQFNDDWKIQNGMIYVNHNVDTNETYTGGFDPATNKLSRFAWFGKEEYDLHNVYLNLTGKFDTFGIKHSVLLGGDFFNQDKTAYATDDCLDSACLSAIDIFNPVFPSTQGLIDQFDNIPLSAFRNQQRGFYNKREDTWYGLYFQDQMAFFDDKLLIMGGGRYDWAHIAQEDAYFTPLELKAETYANFSPRVGITYKPWDWLALYGNFVESFSNNSGFSGTGELFDPQQATQYEAGLKTELFDGRLTSTLAYYHLTKTNILTPSPNNPNFSLPVGEARSQGIELDVAGQLTDGLSMIATYAYTDARITKDNTIIDGSSIEGNRLPYVPEHSGSFWLKYDFQQPMLNGFSVGAGLYAASSRLGNVANDYGDGAYARLDLFGAYRHKIGATNLTAQVNINNVSDTEYFILRDKSRNLPAEPLTVMGSLRLEY